MKKQDTSEKLVNHVYLALGSNLGNKVHNIQLSKFELERFNIKILKSSNDGFFIAEEDMKLRGFGDILGYQQSGIKNFKLADPVHHEELFNIAEENIKDIESDEKVFKKYDILLKLFDKADIINQINLEEN